LVSDPEPELCQWTMMQGFLAGRLPSSAPQPAPPVLLLTLSDNLDGNHAVIIFEDSPPVTHEYFEPGQTVVIRALPADENNVFSHWINGYDEIISHLAEFEFEIVGSMTEGDLTLTAIYTSEEDDAEEHEEMYAKEEDEETPEDKEEPEDEPEEDDDMSGCNMTNPQDRRKEEDYEPEEDELFDPDPDPDLETDYEPMRREDVAELQSDIRELDVMVSGYYD